ncbi:MAG: hypothetical protein A3H24_13635 [Rhodoferax sp. RIFCSPLOWO2_12_FULL_60_11]|nr:MAG: hypothetical protein A3H24_13635 [Rhodoferax sp. RIFCSPLOWO2_12_FULL_60_11]
MSAFAYGMADFHSIAAGAAVLASGGGGSYQDALAILQQLADSGWRGTGALWVVNGDGAGRAVPDTIAPDSICYYSEGTGRGFSNASDDLAAYFAATTGKSTGNTVSIIHVTAAPQLCQSPGVVASFASLLRNTGYAGAMPSAC